MYSRLWLGLSFSNPASAPLVLGQHSGEIIRNDYWFLGRFGFGYYPTFVDHFHGESDGLRQKSARRNIVDSLHES